MKTLGILFLAFLATAVALRADPPVIVHEWGTFTCLQDENGAAIGGINVDDEPVPDFVYTTGEHQVHALNGNPWTFGLPPYQSFQGKAGTTAPVGDPSVTMRLETPVIYIYPPKNMPLSSVPPLDVHVDFHGGFLSQYYPFAESGANTWRIMDGPSDKNPRTPMANVTSHLDWKGIRLGSNEKPVVTDDKVWTTPRETSAPLLEVHPKMKDVNGIVHDDAQVEHFLFYRGVGHLDSPLRYMAETDSANSSESLGNYSDSWLVDIRCDGTCAFSAHHLERKREPFKKERHSVANLTQLKASMHDALVKEGLYDDEATAMLKTWELSYFKSPGLRLFYIVPRAWTDKELPLTVTGANTEITRVMVGRIELISDEQKAALERLAKEPAPDLNALKNLAIKALNAGSWSDDDKQAFSSGNKPLTELGIALPQPVTDYLSLGRFRDALIVHFNAEHPSDTLTKFIGDYHLGAAN